MSVKEAATNLVRSALDGTMRFLVLRGLDAFARTDGDIDVLVPRGRGREALKLVSARAAERGWIVAGVRDIGYISQLCLVDLAAEGERDRAVKIDLWDGVSWAAIGADPWGDALLDGLDGGDAVEIVGLVTFLQKMLYAGFLRDRDRERIASAVDATQVAGFVAAHGVPLTAANLQSGRVGRAARWRLRATSSGVVTTGLPFWVVKVIWYKLRFAVVRSSLPGVMFAVTGTAPRRAAAIERCRDILGTSGYPEPVTGAVDAAWSAAAWRKWWAATRGELVLLDAAQVPSTGPLAGAVPLQLSEDNGGRTERDVETVLAGLSEAAVRLSKEAGQP